MGAKRFLLLAVPLAMAVMHAAAYAEADDDPDERALILFRLGRFDLASGQLAEARSKFADSERLNPEPGTMLNVAYCDEHLGKTASAWAEYLSGAGAARAKGRVQWAEDAERQAKRLEPLLPRIVVHVERAADGAPPLLLLDGTAFPKSLCDLSTPVDPGPHRLVATAAGRRPWESTVEAQPGVVTTVTVPLLELEALEVQPAQSVTVPPSPPRPLARAAWSTRQTVAVAVGAAGVASIATAAGLAVWAESTYQGAGCTSQCTSHGASMQSRAWVEADIASVVAGLGASALVGAGILWFGDSHGRDRVEVQPVVGPSALGISVERGW
jgi:hypothetical protein